MPNPLDLPPLPDAVHDSLRREVRQFLAAELDSGGFEPRCDSWLSGSDPAFSRRLGTRGWIGMTWPKRYGGAERSALERYAVIEELLAAGAPVAAHWIADRQSGPAILRYGTERARQELLPRITRGECYISIGMSEPDTGSDLASVRTRAVPVPGAGWSVSGTKIWTSHAHYAHYLLALVRTGEQGPRARHDGLSQLLIDLSSPGVSVRPILLLDGEHHFNEVILDDVAVPAHMLLGEPGAGWEQVTRELALERSGPERILSTFPLFRAVCQAARSGQSAPEDAAGIGGLAAELMVLRQLSMRVAAAIDAGQSPEILAALVKDAGTQFENRVIEVARPILRKVPEPGAADPAARLLASAILHAPGFTLRGGSTEILRGIIARGLGATMADAPVAQAVRGLLAPFATSAGAAVPDDLIARAWAALEQAGFTGAGVPERDGGSGGTLADAAEVVAAAAGTGVVSPVAETLLAASPLCARSGLPMPTGIVTVAAGPPLRAEPADDSLIVTGHASRVPFARHAAAVLVTAVTPAGDGYLCRFDPAAAVIARHASLAGEPRDDLRLDACPIRHDDHVRLLDPHLPGRMMEMARATQIAGALAAVLALTVAYARQREQFGQPIGRFQAVAHLLAALAAQTMAARAAADAAVRETMTTGPGLAVTAARIRCGAAAGEGASLAHQVHGAIGFTLEHPLHRLTRQLWSWRDEPGGPAADRERGYQLGRAVLGAGRTGDVWPMIAGIGAGR